MRAIVRYYKNNENIKGIGQNINYTEDQISEYIKCVEDPIYFINNFCTIVTLDNGLQPFKLYNCQEKLVRTINDNRKILVMQSRQSGKTQVSAAYILWYTLFQPSKTVAILANKGPAAREVLFRYQLMYEHLPHWLQQGIRIWNKGNIELENGSIVFTGATSASGIRGRSVNLLYIDEAAIIQNTIADQFFASVYPTISSGKTTKILISSTPLGYNHFWRFFNDAENGRNDFKQVFIPYTEIPGRDAAWAKEQLRLLGDVKFNQEILCSFQGSSFTLVNALSISQLSPKPPVYSKDNFDVYERPTVGRIYCIVADTAKGVGEDYSAFVVIDMTEVPYKIVGKYRDNTISPLLYPSIIYKVAKEYNEAYVLVEVNTSEQVAHILYYEYEYDNMILIKRGLHGQNISGGFGGSGSIQLGVTTDKKVKRIGCANLKALVEEGRLLIPDAEIIAEMSTFVQVRDSFAADDGYHDDLMMTLVLFSWAMANQYFRELNNVDIRKNMYEERIKAIEDELTPFGFYNDGTEEVVYNF